MKLLLVKCGNRRRSLRCSPPPKQRLPIVLAHLIPSGGMRPRRCSHSDELLAPRVGNFPPGSTSDRGTRARGCCRGLPRLNRLLLPVLPDPVGPWHPRQYDGASLFGRYSAPTARLPILLLAKRAARCGGRYGRTDRRGRSRRTLPDPWGWARAAWTVCSSPPARRGARRAAAQRVQRRAGAGFRVLVDGGRGDKNGRYHRIPHRKLLYRRCSWVHLHAK